MSCRQQQAVTPYCHEPHAIVIVLATLAGNEYHMPANLAHDEDFLQLEDDVVGFLPTVSDMVFGCELDLIVPDTQLPLFFWHESRRYVCRFCTSHLGRVRKELLYRLHTNKERNKTPKHQTNQQKTTQKHKTPAGGSNLLRNSCGREDRMRKGETGATNSAQLSVPLVLQQAASNLLS